MAFKIPDTTVRVWELDWLAGQKLAANLRPSYSDYRLSWAIVQNELDGTDKSSIGTGTVHKYIKGFQATLAAESSPVTVSEPVEPILQGNLAATLMLLQDTLIGLALESEAINTRCRQLGRAVSDTVNLLQDTQIIDRLTADAKRLTTNLDVAVKGEEAARKETAMIRNKAIVQTHGEATGI